MTERRELIDYIATTTAPDALLTTGEDPSSLSDLLVVGVSPREKYLGTLADSLHRRGIAASLCDDAVVIPSVSMGVAYYTRTSLDHAVHDLSKGLMVDPVVKPWSTGPWLPEAFASDLQRAHHVSGDISVANSLRIFDKYPQALCDAICASTAMEIAIKARRVENVASQLDRDILRADICLAGLRYLHAHNRSYFRGLRYLGGTVPALPVESRRIAEKLAAGNTNFQEAIDLSV